MYSILVFLLKLNKWHCECILEKEIKTFFPHHNINITLFQLFFTNTISSCIFAGGYDKEEKAARAYDLAALKYWGATTTTTNFPVNFMFSL